MGRREVKSAEERMEERVKLVGQELAEVRAQLMHFSYFKGFAWKSTGQNLTTIVQGLLLQVYILTSYRLGPP